LFRDKWAIAVFADTGSAFNGTEIELSTGVGVGLRWYSPLGPIRLDFAHPLDDPDTDLRLHISLGPDF
jgi:translocation and assembly module TamA